MGGAEKARFCLVFCVRESVGNDAGESLAQGNFAYQERGSAGGRGGVSATYEVQVGRVQVMRRGPLQQDRREEVLAVLTQQRGGPIPAFSVSPSPLRRDAFDYHREERPLEAECGCPVMLAGHLPLCPWQPARQIT